MAAAAQTPMCRSRFSLLFSSLFSLLEGLDSTQMPVRSPGTPEPLPSPGRPVPRLCPPGTVFPPHGAGPGSAVSSARPPTSQGGAQAEGREEGSDQVASQALAVLTGGAAPRGMQGPGAAAAGGQRRAAAGRGEPRKGRRLGASEVRKPCPTGPNSPLGPSPAISFPRPTNVHSRRLCSAG